LRRGLVRLWFSREPFSHLVVLPAQIQWGHSTLRKWTVPCFIVVGSILP
jgi:hypothetical protein